VRSTTYSTYTETSTLSTAYVCYLKNYACSGGRRRRNVVIEEPDNANAPVLADVQADIRDLVKRTADEHLIDLKDITHITFYPSKVKEADFEDRKKRDAKEDAEEEISVQNPSETKARFFFSGVTVMQTSTTTTTSTLTTTIGTVGITGTKSACAGTSISTYFSKCG